MPLPVLQKELTEIGIELEEYRHALKAGELHRGFACLNQAHHLMMQINNRPDIAELVHQFRQTFGPE